MCICVYVYMCMCICVYVYMFICVYVQMKYVYMSGCQNPVTLCSILASLSPTLSRTFRDAVFFFRGIHVSEIHFRDLSRKTCDKSSSFSAVKYVLKPLIPLPYQMGGGIPASQGFRGAFAKLSRIFGSHL